MLRRCTACLEQKTTNNNNNKHTKTERAQQFPALERFSIVNKKCPLAAQDDLRRQRVKGARQTLCVCYVCVANLKNIELPHHDII
jgi:hypothetical protein